MQWRLQLATKKTFTQGAGNDNDRARKEFPEHGLVVE
jgi:hypothetical protein